MSESLAHLWGGGIKGIKSCRRKFLSHILSFFLILECFHENFHGFFHPYHTHTARFLRFLAFFFRSVSRTLQAATV